MDNIELTEYGVEEDVSNTQKKVVDFFQKNIYEIAIVAVCLVRVVAGLANIQESGKGVAEIIGDSVMSIIFALMLARMLECKGLAVGARAQCYTDAIDSYWKLAQRAGKHINKMDKWCKKYSEEKYEDSVTKMLFPLGLTFEQFKKGDYDEQKFSKSQNRQLAKVRKFRAHAYSTEELMSGELDFKPDKDYSKVSKKEYIKNSARSDLIIKVVIAFVFGYFSLPPISAWDWGGFIWTLFETVLIFGISVMKYFNAYNYVVEDICEKVVNKTTILKRFLEDVEGEIAAPAARNDKQDEIAASQAPRNDIMGQGRDDGVVIKEYGGKEDGKNTI